MAKSEDSLGPDKHRTLPVYVKQKLHGNSSMQKILHLYNIVETLVRFSIP